MCVAVDMLLVLFVVDITFSCFMYDLTQCHANVVSLLSVFLAIVPWKQRLIERVNMHVPT